MWFPLRFPNRRARAPRPQQRHRSRARTLRCEPLEPRTMLADVAGTAVAVDLQGNIYATGRLYDGWADFDPGPGEVWLAPPGPHDVEYPPDDGYLVKYNPDKTVAWAKQLTGDGGQRLWDVVVGGDGFVYVAGSVDDNATFDGHALPTLGSAAVLAKLSPEGDVLWAEKFGDSPTSASVQAGAKSIAPDGAGQIYVSGQFLGGTGDFDPSDGTNVLTAQGTIDQYIAKFDCGDGQLDWVVQLGTSSEIRDGSLAADSTGVYSGGAFSGTIYLGDLPDLTDVNPYYSDGFLVKLSTDANNLPQWEWAKQYADVNGICVATDGSFVYAAASQPKGSDGVLTSGQEFVAKYTTDGAEQWFKPWANGMAYDITASGGNLYLTGSFRGTVDFNLGPAQSNLTANGSYDIFVWKMTDGGQLTWAGQMGGPGTSAFPLDMGKSIAVDAFGNVFTTGRFAPGPADFNPGPAVATMSTLGNTDAFISKLDSNMNYQWAFQIGSYEKYADDGGPGYQEIGTGWKSSKFAGGYAGDYRYHAKGTGANKAQWTFSGLVAGTYDVYATWFVDRQNVTNAQYTVNGAAAPLINQRISPDDLAVNSTPDHDATTYWERLGVYAADAQGKITVVLSDKANGQVIADGIRLIINTPAGAASAAPSLSSAQTSMSPQMAAAIDFAMSDVTDGATGRKKSAKAEDDLLLAMYDPAAWL